MNALQTLISETMVAKSLRKAEIVALLGFKNINKGIRRFDAFAEGAVDSSGMLDRLCRSGSGHQIMLTHSFKIDMRGIVPMSIRKPLP